MLEMMQEKVCLKVNVYVIPKRLSVLSVILALWANVLTQSSCAEERFQTWMSR